MDGWIKLHRKTMDNPIVCKDADHLAVWIYLLTNATHKEYPAVFAGEKIMLQPGQLITGRQTIGEKFNIHESKVQRILKKFENEHQIEQRTSNHKRLISILSWADYQSSEQPDEHQMNNQRTTDEQPVNTNKNVKNVKNNKNERKKESVPKIQFAEFVSMTQVEYDKLIEQHGEDRVRRMIEILDNYKGANKKKYASDYRAILNWVVDRVQEEERKLKVIQGGGQGGRGRINERTFGTDRTTQKPTEYIGTPGSNKVVVPDDFEQQLRNFE